MSAIVIRVKKNLGSDICTRIHTYTHPTIGSRVFSCTISILPLPMSPEKLLMIDKWTQRTSRTTYHGKVTNMIVKLVMANIVISIIIAIILCGEQKC
jgi:hypothetical protein